MVNKWTVSDGTLTFIFAVNPSAMTTPYAPKDVTVGGMNIDGSFATVQNPTKAAEWTLTGNVYSTTEYGNLKTWHDKDIVLLMTDHLGRTWNVLSLDLNMTDRRDTRNNSQRYTYTWKLLNLGEAI